MNATGVRLGVAVGMITTIAALFPALKITMGDCFFEQGCGTHENLQLLGVVLASCLFGLVTALVAARIYTMVASRGTHKIPALKRAVPTERGKLVLEYSGAELRVFDSSALARQWPSLLLPPDFGRFSVSDDAISWVGGRRVTAAYLYENSQPTRLADLENEVVRLSYRNQAPTSEHNSHHVYGVFVTPFASKLFSIGESIGGGFSGREESTDYSITELLAWHGWKRHFELSGCSWAVPMIENLSTDAVTLRDSLIAEASRRNGLAEDA